MNFRIPPNNNKENPQMQNDLVFLKKKKNQLKFKSTINQIPNYECVLQSINQQVSICQSRNQQV